MPEGEARPAPTVKHGERRLSEEPAFGLDPGLVANMTAAYGPVVGAWFDALPSLVGALASRWSLEHVRPLRAGYAGFSVLLEGQSLEHGPVVVKLVPPQEDGQDREAVTLAAWHGAGAVRLLDRDVERQALLLRRLTPGTPLDVTSLDDDDATRALAEVAARLAVPPTPEVAALLPDLSIWGEELETYVHTYGPLGPIAHDLVDAARGLLDRLLATAPEPVLLHGDLHHDNVLRDGDAWVAIDPKGYVGDAASEPSQMFFNPVPYVRPLGAAALAELVDRRLAGWARWSDLDPARVRDWAVVKSVLSDVWSVEDLGQADGLASRVARELLAREGG